MKVENQLGKTIKAIRSVRGGEYISQEFKDYLKACGIVQQLTPTYTPQHNGVSERRNRTLLDMVRSMMNLITLLLSFWDYALETATHILNMVPTKKVDKTSYELCRRAEELEEIQDKDTSLSKNTSEIPMEVEGFKTPQEEVVPIRRSARIHQAPDRLCLNVDVMNAKMQSIKDNQVWCLVDLPPNLAKGYTQTYGVYYEETFSHVANIRAIRILIAITTFYDYEIWQMDIKTVFLNGYLNEDIYMVQPEEAGIKIFDEKIKRLGFAQNLDEPCVYQKASGSNVTFLILYDDDIIIMGNNIPSLQSVKDYLGKCFAMKDLWEAAFILGIKIYRDRSKRLIGLGQNAYMDKILKRYKMDNSKRGTSTPKEVKRMQNVPYALDVGSIMYAVRCTRPDVAFAQNITSRFQQNLGEL
ncbi:retrotransposon protein, putative, ty1-copia subclass [Tanacetum coccineum]